MNLKQNFVEKEVGKWCSISKIKINNNRLIIDNKIYKSRIMLNSLENCSGNYNIDEIKSVKLSSKQLWGVIFIFFYLIMFLGILYSIFVCFKTHNANLSNYELGALIPYILGLICIISLRVKTIKITFNDNKIIHIPIKLLIESYLSIDYKEEIIEFMNILNAKN